MSLLLSGMAAGFSVEIDKTVAAMGAQSWVVAAKSPGRVGTLTPIPVSSWARWPLSLAYAGPPRWWW
jgi:hypothetical protein